MKSSLIVTALALLAVVGFEAGEAIGIQGVLKTRYIIDMLTQVADGRLSSADLTLEELVDAYKEARAHLVPFTGEQKVDYVAYSLLDELAFKPIAKKEISIEDDIDMKIHFTQEVEKKFSKLYKEKKLANLNKSRL